MNEFMVEALTIFVQYCVSSHGNHEKLGYHDFGFKCIFFINFIITGF